MLLKEGEVPLFLIDDYYSNKSKSKAAIVLLMLSSSDLKASPYKLTSEILYIDGV